MKLKSIFLSALLCNHAIFFSHNISASFRLILLRKPVSEFIAIAKRVLESEKGSISKALFVPRDQVKHTLLGLIYNEQVSIDAALFRLTDHDVIGALIDAKQRGIKIRLILDQGNIFEQSERIALLSEANIPIHVQKTRHTYMHNKFWIFGKNFNQRRALWTGSANATRNGLTRNAENVFITDNFNLLNYYKEHFNTLWNNLENN